MDFARLLHVLLRRWVIVVVGLVVSLAAAFGVYKVIPRSYEATSEVMLLLRPTANNPNYTVSPFLYLPDGLNTLGRVLMTTLNTPEARASMASDGFRAGYTIELQRQGPIVGFTVVGPDLTNTLETRAELMRRFESELSRIQKDEEVPSRQLAHTRVLEASDHVSVVSEDAFRGAAGTGVAGMALTLLVIALVELRSRRRAERAGQSADQSEDQPGPRRAASVTDLTDQPTADDAPSQSHSDNDDAPVPKASSESDSDNGTEDSPTTERDEELTSST